MDVAREVIELFTSKDAGRCQAIARKLDLLNGERQNEEARIVREIEARLAAEPDLENRHCLVFDGDGWHRGVVGIVASRVVEKTGRPALVVAKQGEEAHGSGRSISGLHLLEALESCRDLFTRFGGHEHAVGFSLPSAQLDALKERLNAFARARLSPEDLVPEVDIDAEIPLSSVTPELRHDLLRLEPFGQGNPDPVFLSRGVDLLAPPRIIKEKHVKLRVRQQQPTGKPSFSYQVMGWRMAEQILGGVLQMGDQLDLAFKITVNDHPEFGGLELVLEDFRRSGATTPASDKTYHGDTEARRSASYAE
jgi:single-stranded-DNA-specific exonuclease